MGGKYWEIFLFLLTNGHLEKVQSLCSKTAPRAVVNVTERAVAFWRGLGDAHRCSPIITKVSPRS